MNNKEIREMTDAELAAQVADLRREKLNLKIQSRTGQLEKTARVREVRRDIARCLTEMTARAAKEEVKARISKSAATAKSASVSLSATFRTRPSSSVLNAVPPIRSTARSSK